MIDRHILLLTFPAQGAINPAFQLAKHLIRMGVKVTIVTTVSAHRRMTKSAPIPDDLTIAAFSDGYDDGFKNRDDHQHFLSEFKSHGSRAVAELITASRKEGHPITRLVYTMLQTWAAKLAHDLHVQSTLFGIQPAPVFQIYYYYFNGYGDLIRKNSTDTSCPIEIPGLPLLTSRDLPSFLVPSNSNLYSFALPSFKEQLELLDTETKPKILPTNAKLIEDVWKTGVRVTANEEGLVKGDEIKRCIEMVMGGGERGEELRKNAKKWKALARDAQKEGGSLDINLKAFVDEL
ncbi:hypothetical protein F0562_000030 [Nyssa sinensis]|uniref:Uncharacterized protein n=1 Tax=Nyssa sinensis TaxID=561372 RepID=A0A5J5C0D3_9ASTE|nr:hypothetical protein F0562_000030 [Nyssa sinensis]